MTDKRKALVVQVKEVAPTKDDEWFLDDMLDDMNGACTGEMPRQEELMGWRNFIEEIAAAIRLHGRATVAYTYPEVANTTQTPAKEPRCRNCRAAEVTHRVTFRVPRKRTIEYTLCRTCSAAFEWGQRKPEAPVSPIED